MELTTIVLILMWLGIRLGLGLFFKKADISRWKAFIPILSTLKWLELIKKPKWWLILSFIPVVNIVLGIGMIVELMNSFGRRNVVEHVLASVIGFIYLPYIGLTKDLELVGPVDYSKQEKGRIREWSEAIFFAVIAATIIRTFAIEAFTIPTSSMEGTLLRGDFLFVSKAHYGAKTPKTPLAFPFMHHSMPVLGIPAYLDWIELPSFRFPAFQDVERNDIVVFNYPREDYRPIDKREHYIKRCVGIAGDTIRVNDGNLSINSKKVPLSKTGQMSYQFLSNNPKGFYNWLKDRKLNRAECGCQRTYQPDLFSCMVFANERNIENLKQQSFVKSELTDGKIRPWLQKDYTLGNIYPNSYSYGNNDSSKWTRDFYGPLWIPQEGVKIQLTENNYNKYKRVFQAYENVSVISLKELKENYKRLESFIDIEIQNGDWRKLSALAYEAKDLHSFLSIGDKMSKWSDGYFIKTYVETQLGSNQKKIKSEFSKVFKEYKNGVLKQELDSIKNILDLTKSQENKELFYINGQITNSYTFKQNYYFMMGDNRHNSGDSRAWGFVPKDHIVGKAVFIWLSIDPDEDKFPDYIRWDRVCSFVSPEGNSRSYMWEFLIGGTILYFANKWWKKKKKAKKEAEA